MVFIDHHWGTFQILDIISWNLILSQYFTMGCTQSTALKTSDPMHVGKSERGPRIGTKGVSMKSMQTSVPTGAPAFNPYEDSIQPPKLNGDGKLTTEEVLRRTSSSSNVTSVTIGNQVKSGKSVHVQVSNFLVFYASFADGELIWVCKSLPPGVREDTILMVSFL